MRFSYHVWWHLPGGVRYGENPEAAVRRGLAEKVGISASGAAACGLTI
jgi:ADP-ribose pyrophosphatase YjhB (NUDIX family)